MKKILWIIILAFIVIVGAVLYWSLMRSSAPAVPLSFTGTTTVPVINETSGTGTVPQTQSSPSTAGNAGNIIDPGSDAPQIVGSNLMLAIGENSKLGNYLVGYTGHTLYTYEKDTGASSTCYAQCASTWPPYIVSASDVGNFQYGVDPLKVSIITRADGTLQVTYDGHPLYFYSGDTGNDSTLGQGLGGVWYVVKP